MVFDPAFEKFISQDDLKTEIGYVLLVIRRYKKKLLNKLILRTMYNKNKIKIMYDKT